MPPKRTANPKNGRAAAPPSSDPEPDTTTQHEQEQEGEDEEEEEVPQARIPEELVARILNELFKREDTRVSRAAGSALSRYFEIFVQEAIARTAQERNGRFLEVGFPSLVCPPAFGCPCIVPGCGLPAYLWLGGAVGWLPSGGCVSWDRVGSDLLLTVG